MKVPETMTRFSKPDPVEPVTPDWTRELTPIKSNKSQGAALNEMERGGTKRNGLEQPEQKWRKVSDDKVFHLFFVSGTAGTEGGEFPTTTTPLRGGWGGWGKTFPASGPCR